MRRTHGRSIWIVALPAAVALAGPMLCMGTRAPAAAAATRAPRQGDRDRGLVDLARSCSRGRHATPFRCSGPDGRLLSFMAPVDGALNLWVGPATAPDSARPLTAARTRARAPALGCASGKVLYRWNASGTRLLYPRDTNGNGAVAALRPRCPHRAGEVAHLAQGRLGARGSR